ncbi:class I glutamine amidotransferase-like protein [Choiromyces venosus 120613-1]|uniref:D-lactate dehydratase n=1 Tax=Choiromyces venosus 120613-1 TaxID=1336337 RepID=A0A3N4JA79_9PEZI|nr:class I glutamine amidotransferase-like protein [Choiromyces venosus 120613-1]
MAPKVLFVLTSQKTLGASEKPTGWYLPEFAHPYHVLAPYATISVASPGGGEAPLDPGSVEMFKSDELATRFLNEKSDLWKSTIKLEGVNAADYDGIFFVGGHGPMFDIARAPTTTSLVKAFAEADKLIGAVCHGSAALLDVRLSNGKLLVDGEPVTGFSNAEEDATGLSGLIPFMLETDLMENGAKYEKADQPWGAKVCVGRGGKLITGQNPASGVGVGEKMKLALGV